MAKTFTKIGLIGRQGVKDISDTLTAVLDYLQLRELQVFVEQETALSLKGHQLTGYPSEQLAEKVDLFIVVGGDGSFINAAHSAVEYNVPVLGVNQGHLGFLTDVLPQDLKNTIGQVLDGSFEEEERFLLKVTMTSKVDEKSVGVALNEVVLKLGDVPRMIEFSITIDDQFVCEQRADGLIVATPTGSTAYALSGGGPIVHPQLDAVVLVPMFPHTLSARPIVVSAESHIMLHVSAHNLAPLYLNCDGQTQISVPMGADITIQKNKKPLRLIHPLAYNYFETLRTKLHWNKNSAIK